ncbi:hypothetical protein L211DRAFT_832313 [Terfezia boudieri ATCC MYA-4762]|uniref:Uncharacterized protein n=1 Tax=Terfezia boudieri ATCC MYA-4762 TaxID=1051890 RepID=A0A3N4M3L6_9PEZI|nr:hypothetical protein L211DRAFT_832313 [Terfezia boudieri ATCC MYA-4762]
MPPAVDPDSSNTLGNPEHLNIPPDLPPNFRHWNRDHVKRYLEDNKDEYGLDQEDIDLIYEGKIRGRHFPKMTVEMLVKDYQLPRGTAVSVQELITFVVNPPQSVPVVTPDIGQDESLNRKFDILEEIREDVKALRQMTVEIFISRVSSSQYKSILNYLGLQRVSLEFEVPPVNRTFEEFSWGPEKEDAQMDNCLAWLRTHIILPENMQFHPVANNTSFLNYTVGEGTSKYFLKGTTDIIVLPTRYVRDFNAHSGMQLAIELKKEIKEADCRQAIMELIATNAFSNYPVVVLLTDLKGLWQFSWFNTASEGIESVTFGLHCGVALMEYILHGRGDGPYINRCRLKDFFREGGSQGVPAESTPGQGSMLEQQGFFKKVDPFDLVPRPEVANMEEFFDEMSEVEVKKWKFQHVMNHISEAPGWKSMYV